MKLDEDLKPIIKVLALAFVILILSFFCSCKTKHKAQEFTKIEKTQKAIETKTETQGAIETTQTDETTETEEVIIIYLPPDTAGRQAISSVTERKTKKGAKTLVEKKDSTIASAEVKTESEETITTETKKELTHNSKPTWLIWVAIIAVVTLIIYVTWKQKRKSIS